MADSILNRLQSLGATAAQLVDLSADVGPRALPYLDLTRGEVDRPSVVFEVQGQARAYIFAASAEEGSVERWIRRVAFRGDADWVGVSRPGRLDVYRAALDGRSASEHLVALPQGPFLFPSLVHGRQADDDEAQQRHRSPAPSVRGALFKLLRASISRAQKMGVDPDDALSLVGRAVFWRFLVDRQLLDGLDPERIAPGATSFEACLENRPAALQTFAWLDETFNGGLLPFSSVSAASRIPANVYETVVAKIAYGATADGQLSLALPRQWRDVNFAHVPVGLLSEVYETFSHELQHKKAKAESVFYTPRNIAAFVVDEALAEVSAERPRVLDPAAGAGVFLVTAFRALVAREWAREGEQPSRKALRRILNTQLTGFDINEDALRLAELALYLTAIEMDPEPRPRPLSLLRFESLRGRVLHVMDGGPSLGSLGEVPARFRGRFDLVVGNPPWTPQKNAKKATSTWLNVTRRRVESLLGPERASEFEFPDPSPDLPFLFRATEWLTQGGAVGFAMQAKWLFDQKPEYLRVRRDLFDCIHVTGVLNGTALRETDVWPNVRHPFCLVFAINERAPEHATMQFVSPELERLPERDQAHLRIDWQNASDVAISEISARPWLLKALFRGTTFDQAVIDQSSASGVPLGRYLSNLGTRLWNGYKRGGPRVRKRPLPRSFKDLRDLGRSELSFFVDVPSLPLLVGPLTRPRPREIYQAPLLVIHESMRVDPMTARAGIAIEDVAFDERFDAASFAGIPDGEHVAAYLQLVIQSSYFTHNLLFLDGQFGVEREVVNKATIERVPIVPWADLAPSLRKHAARLSERVRTGITPPLLRQIDDLVCDTFSFSDVQRQTILDTLATALPTAEAKAAATRYTVEDDRRTFARVCQEELTDLFERDIRVQLIKYEGGPWRFLGIHTGPRSDRSSDLDRFEPRRVIEAAEEASASLVTIRTDRHTILVGLLDQYRYWTVTRARMLASSLASEEHG